jgi:alkylation response protein AidB-like acyl-CoA dehydrogenase
VNTGRLGIGAEHEALHDAARGWCERHVPPSVPRAHLDGGAPDGSALWRGIVEQGWLGLAADYGLLEAGIVLEELGRACTPGSALPTMAAVAALHRLGGPAAVLDDIVAGAPAAVAWGTPPLATAGGRLTGRATAVAGAATAEWLLLPVVGGRTAVLASSSVTVDERPAVDPTRPVADIDVRDVAPVALLDDPDDLTKLVAQRLWAADAIGGAAWCVETAATYATVREQFGQPIGRFQAVKHRCADMLCELERARAAVWDALRCDTGGDEERLASATAAALAPEAFATAAKGCIQVLGGIGFTWEHDAHLYLKRALSTRAVAGAAHVQHEAVARLAKAGVRRAVAVDLPPEAEAVRTAIRAEVEAIAARPKDEWRAALADGGWIVPHWPAPWGREADPVTQLVIDEEMKAAHVRRPHLQVGTWVLPTLIAHGDPAQQERWVGPTLRGELAWCQLFSEPGAGSDLASLTTKAVKTDGGWLLSGQKVWTSMAVEADLGLCLARTDASVPRHDGITAFVVDMTTEGIELRPLRELTGLAMFNEVFLSDVFVPDDAVVGAPGAGWSAARTTLANERVSMGSGSSFGLGVEMVLGLVPDDDPIALVHAGRLLVDAHALAALGARLTLRSLSSATPGSEASVRKLLGVEHDQRTQEVGLELLGRAGAVDEGDAKSWLYGFLANRCLSIAGGTSEIQRNVIAERLLGLPRDSAT